MYPASTVCGAYPKCDNRWGATGKCYASVSLEAKQTCDYYGCETDADCATYPASTVCGAYPKCDNRWGATGKCYAGVSLEPAKPLLGDCPGKCSGYSPGACNGKFCNCYFASFGFCDHYDEADDCYQAGGCWIFSDSVQERYAVGTYCHGLSML